MPLRTEKIKFFYFMGSRGQFREKRGASYITHLNVYVKTFWCTETLTLN